MSQEDIRQAFTNMEARMQDMSSVLVREQAKTADLENKPTRGFGGGSEATFLFGAIRKGRMRDVVPNEKSTTPRHQARFSHGPEPSRIPCTVA